MKILQLVQKPQRRGAEVFAFQLAQTLRTMGHAVRIVYLYPHAGANILPFAAADCLLQGEENHPAEKTLGFHPRLLSRLLYQINDFQPDVVQVNGARTVKYGAFARRFSRKPSWVLVYRNIGNPEDWLHGWHYRLFYNKLVMPRISGIAGVSKTTLANLLKYYNLAIPATNIPGGVDPVALQPSIPAEIVRRNLETPSKAPVLIFVGSLTPEKRPDRLLRLVRQAWIQQPNLFLWIVGDGPLRQELEQQAQKLDSANRVRFLGVRADVANYLNAATLLVLTSDTEGIPAVILEAGFLNLPVVATRVGGLPECVREGETGLLIDPEDEQGLSRAVLALLRDADRRRAMGNRAGEWIANHFTMDVIAKQYVTFYHQVLSNGKKR